MTIKDQDLQLAEELLENIKKLCPEGRLVNVKFFPVTRTDITAAQIIAEASKGLEQILSGTSKKINNLDANTPTSTIKEFLNAS